MNVPILSKIPDPCQDTYCGHGSCEILRRLIAEQDEELKRGESEFQRQEWIRKIKEGQDE